ncbi:MAG: hypothetical protein ABW133_05610 [Polyangiaceae bacterium]
MRFSILSVFAVATAALVIAAPAPSHAVVADDSCPLDGACEADCNRKASDCIDACEEKFKDEDKARVTCKYECTQKRQQCQKSCE